MDDGSFINCLRRKDDENVVSGKVGGKKQKLNHIK
jgi:hypothetical protein